MEDEQPAALKVLPQSTHRVAVRVAANLALELPTDPRSDAVSCVLRFLLFDLGEVDCLAARLLRNPARDPLDTPGST
jgi:hypothetical protein